MSEYRVNKKTNILKNNPNKKDEFGAVGTDVVGTLQEGQIIEITKVGGGGRGVMTPYLFFADGTYIVGFDADKYISPFGDTSKLLNAPPDMDLGRQLKWNMDAKNKSLQDAIDFQNAKNQQNNLTSNKKNVPQTFLQKHKNNLLILGAIVIGYFAYKKINK